MDFVAQSKIAKLTRRVLLLETLLVRLAAHAGGGVNSMDILQAIENLHNELNVVKPKKKRKRALTLAEEEIKRDMGDDW